MESLLILLALVVLLIPVLLIVVTVMVFGLRGRVTALEALVAELRGEAAASQFRNRQEAAQPASTTRPDAGAVNPPERVPQVPALPAVTPMPMATAPPVAVPVRPAAAQLPPKPLPPPLPDGPNAIERAIRTIKHWFGSGNVPVKVGMLVLLAGVAALLKYVSDQGWLNAPIELRLAGIAAAALAGLVFGWRQREFRRLFALAVQGGAIGALLLTIFAAFKLYGLVPAGAAFGLSVVLIAGLGVLAVVQNSRTLAVLGILAGFLAPIWLSTGSGNHVALFSYYAVLNAGIFAIAWWRPWRVLNLLGFAFTFGIGTLWGVTRYLPEQFNSTEPFLLLFFAFYLLIPILYARRQAAENRNLVDGSLVFGTPLVAFSLQAGLLQGERMPLALCALALGLLYAGLARALVRRAHFAALGQCYAVLALGFATLAVPLALSARATASVFALEGAALVWLGMRQQRWLPRISGALLQLAAAFGFLVGVDRWHADAGAIINASFMSALLLSLAGFASAWSSRRAHRSAEAFAYYLWGLGWWLGAFSLEIFRFVRSASWPDALLILAAVTGWLAAEVHRRQPGRALIATTLAALVAALPLVLWQVDAHGQPFAGDGMLAWGVFAALGVRSLWCLRSSGDGVARAAQFVWWLVWPLVLTLSASWIADRFELAQGWQLALVALPWLLVTALSIWRWPWLAAPLGERFAGARAPLQTTFLLVLAIGWLQALLQPAAAWPLPWVPLLNPVEMMQLLTLLLAAAWLWSSSAPGAVRSIRVTIVAGAGFLLLTAATLRAVHHWGAVPWDAALWSSTLAQTSLTVVWSMLGVISWILGSRRGQRVLWRVGAVLMAVVLAKLVLIDRQHLGNLLGISSFIAYGLLCTAVGYFAPAPPRAADAPSGEPA